MLQMGDTFSQLLKDKYLRQDQQFNVHQLKMNKIEWREKER